MNALRYIRKILLRTLAILIAIVLLAIGAFYTPWVQAKAKVILCQIIGNQIGMQVNFESIGIGFDKSIYLHHIVITNAANDTVVQARFGKTQLQAINIAEKYIEFSYIRIYKADASLLLLENGDWNFHDFISVLTEEDTEDSTRWTIVCHNIEFAKTNVRIQNFHATDSFPTGIDYNHLELSDLHLTIDNFAKDTHGVSAHISKLSCKEKSGFVLQHFQADAFINSHTIDCSYITIFTEHSKIIAPTLQFSFSDFDDFSDFIEKVTITSNFEHSIIYLSDIAYFTRIAEAIPYNFTLAGNIQGTIAHIKGRKIHLGYGSSSHFVGNVEIDGLPDITQSFIYIDAQSLKTNKQDILNTRIPPYNTTRYVQLPNFLNQVTRYAYSGNFTGFLNDFVAYGTLKTNVGNIDSDMLISKNELQDSYNFKGKLKTKDFNIKALNNQSNNWGTITSSVEIEGTFDSTQITNAKVTGDVAHIEFKDYDYKNIQIDGLLATKKFDGSLRINDKSLQLTFHGLFDYSQETPSFNFSAAVPFANLHALHLHEDSLSRASCKVDVDFVGIELDNIKGTISVPHIAFISRYGKYESRGSRIFVDNIMQTRNADIRSDLFDLTINGKGSYKELPHFFYQFIKRIIPSLPEHTFAYESKQLPNFNMSLKIKKIDSLLTVFYPKMTIAQNSFINAAFSEETQQLVVQSHIPEFNYEQYSLKNISCNITSSHQQLHSSITFDYDSLKQNTIELHTQNDSLQTLITWNNTNDKRNEGKLEMDGFFAKSAHAILPAIHIHVPKQSIYVADTLWNIYSSEIIIDSSSVRIPIGSFGKQKQRVTVEGTISKNPDDICNLNFFNYDLDNFNYIINNDKIKLSGALEGVIRVKDAYNRFLILADVSSENFMFNNHDIGKLSILSRWLPDKKSIGMAIHVQQGDVQTFTAKGSYTPHNNAINYNITTKDLRLQTFYELFSPTLTQLTGYIDSNIKASGYLQEPVFTGNLELKRGKFTIRETQVGYSTKGKIESNGSRFVFQDLPITDSLNNSGKARGYIDLKNIKNPAYLVVLETDKITAMNTTEKHSENFYGEVYYKGNLVIRGNLDNTSIIASGKTLQNTKLNIPLAYSELKETKDFLHFTNTNSTPILSTTNNTSTTDLQFNLNITPDAATHIIFDKRVGDIIKVRGSGAMQINIDKHGNLSMFGDYSIESGDYLYTLMNLINKKFTIQQGGTIIFNGNPLEAQINVKANYDLKASPLAIMPALDSKDSTSYKKRIPVQCDIQLEQNLLNPVITYDISVASHYSEVQDIINAMSSDERNNQFLSLLLVNSFFSQNETQFSASTASFEMFSNQLNNLIQQSTSNIDVGLNYRPGDEYSANEFELALSTQLLNNRVLVNVNGYSEFVSSANQTKNQNTEIAGDVSIEVKLTPQGNFRLRAFSHNNNDPLENRGNTHGLGIFFTREFNTFSELFKKKTSTQ